MIGQRVAALGGKRKRLVRRFLGQNALTAASIGVAVAPSPGALLVATVSVRRSGALPAAITCVDDGGNTWTSRSDSSFFTANGVRVTQFSTRVGANPGTFTVTGASASAANMGIGVFQFLNASSDLSNANGAPGHANGDPSATLPSAPLKASMVLASYSVLIAAPTIVMPTGFAELLMIAPSGHRCQISSAGPGFAATVIPWNSDAGESVLGVVEIKLG